MSYWRKLLWLTPLYFVQGLPFGVQGSLPAYLRAAGTSLGTIGLLGLLAAPWLFKPLVAPLVDRYAGGRLGPRRSWLVPLQVALASLATVAAFTPPSDRLGALLALVLAMNAVAATLDVAVDALAVDLLASRKELGMGNTLQVVGFKLGMTAAGGLLMYWSAWIGWRGMFLGVAGLVLVSLAVTLLQRESEGGRSLSIRPLLRLALGALRQPGQVWALAFLCTYKLGESMADAMFKPLLVDAGYTPSDIGLWVHTFAMGFSIAGSIAGGLLASRVRLSTAVLLTAAARVLPLGAQWAVSVYPPTPGAVVAISCAEHFFGGALTTAMFAWMMSRVDRRIGATHYAVLSTVEVVGKAPGAWISGFLAQAAGYPTVFALAVGLSIAFLALLAPIRRAEAQAAPAGAL